MRQANVHAVRMRLLDHLAYILEGRNAFGRGCALLGIDIANANKLYTV